MFPPHMVDIDLIRSWMDQQTDFLIDNKRMCIHIDPAKKVQVPTNSWLPNPMQGNPNSRPDSPVESGEYDVTSSYTDLTNQPVDDSDSDVEIRNDIGKEANQERNRLQSNR